MKETSFKHKEFKFIPKSITFYCKNRLYRNLHGKSVCDHFKHIHLLAKC